jgi:hypothetical protein
MLPTNRFSAAVHFRTLPARARALGHSFRLICRITRRRFTPQMPRPSTRETSWSDIVPKAASSLGLQAVQGIGEGTFFSCRRCDTEESVRPNRRATLGSDMVPSKRSSFGVQAPGRG